MKLFEMIYKDTVRTSQETQCFLIAKSSQLMLFKEIIAVGRMRRLRIIFAQICVLSIAVYVASNGSMTGKL
jgi:hypothetical protein